jgi:hypothetical protein
MDNIQNYDSLINIPSSQIYKLFTYFSLHLLCNLLCEVCLDQECLWVLLLLKKKQFCGMQSSQTTRNQLARREKPLTIFLN